jgi:nucleoside-diphosphate-sugar epimerase
VHEALAAGLKVKLAIRNEARAKTLIAALEKIHGKGHIETVIVKDYNDDGAYDEAIKGVEGVVHVASDMTFSSNPDDVIPPVLKAYNTLLEAAHSQKSIRRFVLTSSSLAIGSPNPGGKTTQHFEASKWNDASVEDMKKAPNGMNVYGASKVLSERSAWDFVKKNKPNFALTAILPNANLGAPVPGTEVLTTGKWVTDLATNGHSMALYAGPQFHVDVGDVAKLHVLALIREDVKNERILAFGTAYTANSLIDAVKKVKPDAPTPEPKEEWDLKDNTTVDVQRANELLKDQGGLRDLEYSVRASLESV